MASLSDKYGDKRWSQPVTLATAAKSLPVLVRLEEGNRGGSEETCVSSGDVMALQSRTTIRGRDFVLAHYMRESDLLEDEAAAPAEELYRALMVIPLDNRELAGLEVSTLEDPGGLAYQAWVKSYFPSYNWADKDSEAHMAVASDDIDDDYDDIVVYTYYANVGTVKTIIPSGSDPPVLPPKPRKKVPPDPLPKPAPGAGGRGEELPPPRPPKSAAVSRSISQPAAKAPPKERLPPMPPRRRSDDPDVVLKSYDDKVEDYDPGDDDVYREGQYEEVGCKKEGVYEINLDDDASQDDDGYLPPCSPCTGLGFSFTIAETQFAPAYVAPSRPLPAKLGHRPKPPTPDTKESGGESGGMLKKIENIYKKMTGGKHADAAKVLPVQRTPARIPPVPRSPAATNATSCAADDDDSDDLGEYVEADDSESEDPPYTEIDEMSMMDYQRSEAGKPVSLPPASKDRKKVKKQLSAASEQKARNKKPTMHVRPVQNSPPSSESHHRMMAPSGGVREELLPIENMSVQDLAARLQQCGMQKLSQICQDNHVDGNFFFSDLDAKKLKQPPFSLSDWDITRVEKVKTGWVPKE